MRAEPEVPANLISFKNPAISRDSTANCTSYVNPVLHVFQFLVYKLVYKFCPSKEQTFSILDDAEVPAGKMVWLLTT